VQNRSAKCYNVCAFSQDTTVQFRQIEGYSEMLSGIEKCYDKRHINRIESEVKDRNQKQLIIDLPARSLSSIFAENNIDQVHYLCIDTEGSEVEILKGIDFFKDKN
jgi:FkbM family methyltransferase